MSHSKSLALLIAFVSCGLSSACSVVPSPDDRAAPIPNPPDTQQPPPDTSPPDIPLGQPTLTCNPNIKIDPTSRAMIVTDPEVLARFSLERVLTQLVKNAPFDGVEPLVMLQQLFDSQNSKVTGIFPDVIHCDDPGNGAFGSAPAKFCPRVEGKLASSTGFFQPDHPDYFYPVALVNRFDLTPSAGSNCGEHRIMFAKWSGRTNLNERVFLAFEASMENPQFGDTINGCRPIADMWASLEKESDLKIVADRLEEFYFTGLPGFTPVVMPEHYSMDHRGTDDGGGGYGDPSGRPRRGQVRLSQGMQDPWEFREFHIQFSFPGEPGPALFFAPTTTKNNPRPELFDPSTSLPDGPQFRAQLLNSLPKLASSQGFGIQFSPMQATWNAGSSMISVDPELDFTSRAFAGEPGQSFWADMKAAIAEKNLNANCPTDDPLLPEHLIQRVSVLSCAGCHAPEQFLGSSRAIGCGQTWPIVPQQAHIDEFGKLSPALTDTFLPRRADVFSMYLQGCDISKIKENLEPSEFDKAGLPL